MGWEYAEDCIHLKACRRMQKKVNTATGKHFTRGCNAETCSAYISGDTGRYISVSRAVEYARDGALSIQRGYNAYETYCEYELSGMTLLEIIEAETEEE